jgi:hypothetical protein
LWLPVVVAVVAGKVLAVEVVLVVLELAQVLVLLLIRNTRLQLELVVPLQQTLLVEPEEILFSLPSPLMAAVAEVAVLPPLLGQMEVLVVVVVKLETLHTVVGLETLHLLRHLKATTAVRH